MPTAPKLPKELTKAAWKGIDPKKSPVPDALVKVENHYKTINWNSVFSISRGIGRSHFLKNYEITLDRQIKENYEPLCQKLGVLSGCADKDAKEYKLGSGKASKTEAEKIKRAISSFNSEVNAYIAAVHAEYKSDLNEFKDDEKTVKEALCMAAEIEALVNKIYAKRKALSDLSRKGHYEHLTDEQIAALNRELKELKKQLPNDWTRLAEKAKKALNKWGGFIDETNKKLETIRKAGNPEDAFDGFQALVDSAMSDVNIYKRFTTGSGQIIVTNCNKLEDIIKYVNEIIKLLKKSKSNDKEGLEKIIRKSILIFEKSKELQNPYTSALIGSLKQNVQNIKSMHPDLKKEIEIRERELSLVKDLQEKTSELKQLIEEHAKKLNKLK